MQQIVCSRQGVGRAMLEGMRHVVGRTNVRRVGWLLLAVVWNWSCVQVQVDEIMPWFPDVALARVCCGVWVVRGHIVVYVRVKYGLLVYCL